jgi:hypothetical protein
VLRDHSQRVFLIGRKDRKTTALSLAADVRHFGAQNTYELIQIAFPPVKFFCWSYGFRGAAQVATIKRRYLETLKGSLYQRLETFDAIVFKENP